MSGGRSTTDRGEGGEVRLRPPPRTLADGRFRLEQRLGEGGMGVVHLAYDRESEQWVAVKLLRRVDPQGIYRFKREFRALADLRHDHLVRFYELLEDQGEWFLTMEHLEGQELLDDLHAVRTSMLDLDPGPGGADVDPDGLTPTPAGDMTRLREVFLQIAEAISALHTAGRLHRDLKPQNVIVTDESRAVVLDFGIAAAVEPHGALDTIVDRVVGTPAYMAPEQARGQPPTQASDWYSFGVTLYEALSGELPFDDYNVVTLVTRKQNEDAKRPSTLVSGVPFDLEQLTMALLDRNPEARPDGHTVVTALRRSLGRSAPPPPPVTSESSFAGRVPELASLAAALEYASREASPVIARVQGKSGMGKSALCEQFLREHGRDPDVVILAGRCYEHEAVTFKAFDAIVDALSRYLSGLPRIECAALLPRDVEAMISVFPVMGRVQGMTAARRRLRRRLPTDAVAVRRLAFAALREVLARIALQHPVIVYVDDLQWGDLDSIELLEAITRGVHAPAMLILCAYRSEDTRTSPCLLALEDYRRQAPEVRVRDIQVGPMDTREVGALVALLGAEVGKTGAADLERESGGNPFLLRELLCHVQEHEAGTLASVGYTLDEVIAERLGQLSRDSLDLLRLLSVAARPLPRTVYGLVREHGVDLARAVSELRLRRLVRSLSRSGLTVYHDRIREVAVERMGQAERVLWHRRLALALEQAAERDHASLAYHWFEAYEPELAVEHALRGAEHATQDFAFSRAAQLYQLVLDRGAPDRATRVSLLESLAEVLVLVGRRAEAADTWLWAASEVNDGEHASQLRVRAGRALILAGHTPRALELLGEAMVEHGLPIPDDPTAALQAWFETYRELAERGLEPGPEFGGPLTAAQERRLDLLWAVGLGLQRVVGVRVFHVITRHMVEALDYGDHYRAVRGLCMHYAFVDLSIAMAFGQETVGNLEVAERLTAEADDPRCDAWLLLAKGSAAWLSGEDQALALLDSAHELFTQRCPGSTAERSLSSAMITHELIWTHRWAEIAGRSQGWEADAAARDDKSMFWIKRMAGLITEIVRGDDELAETMWKQVRADVDHVNRDVRFPLEIGHSLLGALRGDEAALRRFLETSFQYMRSTEGGLPRWRLPALQRRAACNLRLATLTSNEDEQASLHAAAERNLDRAAQLGLPRFEPVLLATRAGLARARGELAVARSHLAAAIEACAPGSTSQRHVYRFALADLDDDRDAGARALSQLRDEGLEGPEHTLRAFYPGLLD